jgi:hypothetical protein
VIHNVIVTTRIMKWIHSPRKRYTPLPGCGVVFFGAGGPHLQGDEVSMARWEGDGKRELHVPSMLLLWSGLARVHLWILTLTKLFETPEEVSDNDIRQTSGRKSKEHTVVQWVPFRPLITSGCSSGTAPPKTCSLHPAVSHHTLDQMY